MPVWDTYVCNLSPSSGPNPSLNPYPNETSGHNFDPSPSSLPLLM